MSRTAKSSQPTALLTAIFSLLEVIDRCGLDRQPNGEERRAISKVRMLVDQS